MPLGIEVGLGLGEFVFDGDPAAPRKKNKKAQPHPIWPMYCGQTAECIKMPLGMKAGLGLGDIVLDGDPAPPKQGTVPQFSVHVSIVAKRLYVSGYHLVRRYASA